MTDAARILEPFVEGWAGYQGLLLEALRPLSVEELSSKTAPFQWSVWQLASHMAGTRSYWWHEVLGEGDEATGHMFAVESTTVPDLPLEDAGWEDDENHPRTAPELIDAFEKTWAMLADPLGRWTADDLEVEFPRSRRDGEVRIVTRGWVVWHLIEHDLHHGGEISQILGTNGLTAPDL